MAFRDSFHGFAARVAAIFGTPWAFLAALVAVAVWLATGPLFHFSDTWQLVINTGTTILTFLMVFVIQNTQNRDAKGLHLKLDELIRANRSARNTLIELERFTDRELDELEEEFRRIREARPHAETDRGGERLSVPSRGRPHL